MSETPDPVELRRLRERLEELELARDAAEQGRADLVAEEAALREEVEDLQLELEALRTGAVADRELLARLGDAAAGAP